MRIPTMWYVRPAKPQISLRICAAWSEPLLIAWLFSECQASDWTSFGVTKLKRRLRSIVWVYTCQNATWLEITCRGSYVYCFFTCFHVSLSPLIGQSLSLVSLGAIDWDVPVSITSINLKTIFMITFAFSFIYANQAIELSVILESTHVPL